MGETNLNTLLQTMQPQLNEGVYVFLTHQQPMPNDAAIVMTFKETEGTTLICTKAYADENGYSYATTFAWITLRVHSALEAVGFTAAFSRVLAQHGISCNVVAGYFHDHIFVQYTAREKALAVLTDLAATGINNSL